MKRLISLFIILALAGLLPAYAKKTPTMTQLELREIQTRIFETPKPEIVFKAAINTLQDNGFIIQVVEDEIGYIRAKKEFKGRYRDKRRMTAYSALLLCAVASTALSYGANADSLVDPVLRMQNELADKTIIVDANINIEPYGKFTKVRFTMVQKILENADGYSYVKSAPRKVIRIREPILYTEFFNQMDKNIFYENI